MSSRPVVMVASLAVTAFLTGIVLMRGAVRADGAGTRRVELDDGRRVAGALMRIQAGSYLMQTERDCLVLTGDQIRSIDGKAAGETGVEVPERVVLENVTFERIAPDGALEVHSRIQRTNDGAEALSRVDWGVGAHELGTLADRRVVDEYGNELKLQVRDDHSIRGKRVSVDLPRPVLPGERLLLTDIIRYPDGVRREGDLWVYRHRGDYPEDRLVTRSVLLPAGATVVSIQPEPIHDVTVQGRRLVVWRRYFRAGQALPWEIRYRL